MSRFAPSGQSVSGATVIVQGSVNPSIVNVSMPTAATEYSVILPVGTTSYVIRLRDKTAALQLAFIPGDSGTTFWSIPRGVTDGEGELSLAVPITLYFQSDKSSQILELRYWTS